MDLGLADKVYLVTGASKGLGHAGAAALVADGARVVLSSRDPDRVAAAAAQLNDTGSAGGAGGTERAVGVATDLAADGTAGRLIEVARERFGRLDGALISVGGPPPATAAGATDEQWRAAFESVFLGAVRLARTVARELAAPPAAGGDPAGGAIGFVLSSSSKSPITGLGISNGLRPGLAMVAKDLADEFGPRGVRVVGLLPGRIATDRILELDNANPTAGAAAQRGIPLGRLGEPAEFGRVAAFLLSPAASYLTGLMVPVDGGMLRTY